MGINQRIIGVSCWTYAYTTIRWVAPILRIGVIRWWCPRPLAVATCVGDEVLEQRRRVPPGLAFNVVGVPLVRQTPGAEVVGARRVVLACAPIEVSEPPGGWVGCKGKALRDPSAVLLQVRVETIV